MLPVGIFTAFEVGVAFAIGFFVIGKFARAFAGICAAVLAAGISGFLLRDAGPSNRCPAKAFSSICSA